jgi:hypothetical protein
MRFYGAEYNNIERGEADINIVVLCSIKPKKIQNDKIFKKFKNFQSFHKISKLE